MVECHLAKVKVASSNLVFRSTKQRASAFAEALCFVENPAEAVRKAKRWAGPSRRRFAKQSACRSCFPSESWGFCFLWRTRRRRFAKRSAGPGLPAGGLRSKVPAYSEAGSRGDASALRLSPARNRMRLGMLMISVFPRNPPSSPSTVHGTG